MKKFLKFLFILIILGLIALGGLYFYVSKTIEPIGNIPGETIEFNIDASSYGKTVLKNLEKANVIKNSDVAYYYSRFILKNPMNFKAGKYEINNSWTLETLLNYLSDASNTIQDTCTLKIIEGTWLKDIAKKIESATHLKAVDLMDYWNDKTNLKKYIKEYDFLTEEIFDEDIRYPLEGYLYPDTYEVFVDSSLEQVTTKLLDNFNRIYKKYEKQFDNSKFTVHQIVTLASIIQYEGVPKDMKNISSVFMNRLNIYMPLQSSATRCYALDRNDDQMLCEKDQHVGNPYNTYEYPGLTPGPINSPGEDAIVAALEPAETDYYYFFANICGDGTVYYSKTYAEHLRKCREYLTCYN